MSSVSDAVITKYHFLVVALAGNAVTSGAKASSNKQSLPDVHKKMLIEYTGYVTMLRSTRLSSLVPPIPDGIEAKLVLVVDSLDSPEEAGRKLWNKFGALKTEINNVLGIQWKNVKVTSGMELADKVHTVLKLLWDKAEQKRVENSTAKNKKPAVVYDKSKCVVPKEWYTALHYSLYITPRTYSAYCSSAPCAHSYNCSSCTRNYFSSTSFYHTSFYFTSFRYAFVHCGPPAGSNCLPCFSSPDLGSGPTQTNKLKLTAPVLITDTALATSSKCVRKALKDLKSSEMSVDSFRMQQESLLHIEHLASMTKHDAEFDRLERKLKYAAAEDKDGIRRAINLHLDLPIPVLKKAPPSVPRIDALDTCIQDTPRHDVKAALFSSDSGAHDRCTSVTATCTVNLPCRDEDAAYPTTTTPKGPVWVPCSFESCYSDWEDSCPMCEDKRLYCKEHMNHDDHVAVTI